MDKVAKLAEPEEMESSAKKTVVTHFYKRIVIQAIFNLSYLALALCQRARGPTFLDLVEIYSTDVKTMSLSFSATTIGSLFGGLIGGYLLKRLHHHKFLVMTGVVLNLAFFYILTPFCPSVLTLFAVCFLSGCSVGAIHGGFGHLSFENWHEGNAGPYVQSMHLFFSGGMVLAPIVAKPFLSQRNPLDSSHNNISNTIGDEIIRDEMEEEVVKEGAMHLLYPLLGAIVAITGLAFLYPALSPIPTDQGQEHLSRRKHADREGLPSWWLRERRFLRIFVVFTAGLALAAHFAMDFCISLYLPTFAVDSDLGLTKAQGADLLAIYGLGSFFSRALAILQSMFLWPGIILALDTLLMFLGVALAVFFGQNSLLVFQVAQLITALGIGSTAGSAWLWLGEYVPITSEISTALVVTAALGINVTPLTVGQLLEEWPQIFYLTVTIALIITATCFIAGTIVGTFMLRKEALLKTKFNEENRRETQVALNNEELEDNNPGGEVPYDL